MVLKPRAHAQPPSQERNCSLPLKIGQTDKSPERPRKEGIKLEQQKESRSSSTQFRPNSQSPKRCRAYSSPKPRHNSPSISFLASHSRDLHFDPYGMTSVIKDIGNIKVPPNRDNLYANSKTHCNSSSRSYNKYFSPVLFHSPVRDDSVRTKRKNIVEFIDRTTMTMAHSRVGPSTRHSDPAVRYSDMFLSPSMLAVNKNCEVLHYATCESDKHSLYRTSSYLVATRPPSLYKFYLSPSCLRSTQNSYTSFYSNQATEHIPREFPSQHCVHEKKKVLYNEGIFEGKPYRPKHRMLKTPPSTPIRGGSRHRDHDKSNILVLHNTDSEYRRSSRVVTDFQPTTYHQQVFSGPRKQSKWIALPKRVLQSEFDIDEFLSAVPAIIMATNESIHRTKCPHKFYGEL